MAIDPNALIGPGIPDFFANLTKPNKTGGTKHDDGKVRLDLLPFEALQSTAEVLTFGMKKYDAHNWRKGLVWSRLIAALLRHLFAWISGQDKDPETGLSHLAHASCCLMFLQTFEITNTGLDDRYKPVDKAPGDMIK